MSLLVISDFFLQSCIFPLEMLDLWPQIIGDFVSLLVCFESPGIEFLLSVLQGYFLGVELLKHMLQCPIFF